MKALKTVTDRRDIPAPEIRIEGHAEAPQNSPELEQLSRDRAKVCLEYLLANGVPNECMACVGLGTKVPAKTSAANPNPSSKRVEIHLTNGDKMFQQMLANVERRRKEALRAKAPKLLVYTHVDEKPAMLPDMGAYQKLSTQELLESNTMRMIRSDEYLEFKTVDWHLLNKYVRRDEREIAEQAKVAQKLTLLEKEADGKLVNVQSLLPFIPPKKRWHQFLFDVQPGHELNVRMILRPQPKPR